MKFKITKRLYELSTNLLFFVIPVPIAIGMKVESREGEGTEFEIVNKTMNGFLAFDGYFYGMDIEDKAVIKISDQSMDLSCFDFGK